MCSQAKAEGVLPVAPQLRVPANPRQIALIHHHNTTTPTHDGHAQQQLISHPHTLLGRKEEKPRLQTENSLSKNDGALRNVSCYGNPCARNTRSHITQAHAVSSRLPHVPPVTIFTRHPLSVFFSIYVFFKRMTPQIDKVPPNIYIHMLPRISRPLSRLANGNAPARHVAFRHFSYSCERFSFFSF